MGSDQERRAPSLAGRRPVVLTGGLMRLRRTALALLLGLALGAGPGRAKLPKDYDEFAQRYAKEAVKPEGAAKLWFEAIFVYANTDTREAGRRMLSLVMADAKWERNEYFVDRMKNHPAIFRSYAKGATPANHYAMDPDAFTLVITASEADKFRDEAWRLALHSGGADADRCLTLARTADGHWQLRLYSEIYADVKDG
jgi:hypothetical protein